MFRKVRIFLLLCVLFFVALSAYGLKSRHADWSSTKWVVIYPINADGSAVSDAYINSLEEADFTPVADFIGREARRYHLALTDPVVVKLGPTVRELPPERPPGASMLQTGWWSFKLRSWAKDVDDAYDGPPADIKIFVLYHDPARLNQLDHSVGLWKLSLGLVKAFAQRDMAAQNNIVIAHELLHVVGASDEYSPTTNLPLFPGGYADPGLSPLYPQTKTEIMAGRRPVTETQAKMPESLRSVVIGETTAREINWLH